MTGFRSFINLLLCFTLFIQLVDAQQPDYRSLFSADWNKAEQFLQENDKWIRESLIKYDIPYKEAIAVVFPELVRYSALRDKMETGVLKALYVNLGQDYANFSIGQFQIKPSFAEKIRETAVPVLGKTGRELFGRRQPSDRDLRSLIVGELEIPQKEFSYLIAFYLICKKRFPDLPEQAEERIRFLASAYNTGFWKTREEITIMADRRYYSTKLFSDEHYSYSDIAVYWFRSHPSIQK